MGENVCLQTTQVMRASYELLSCPQVSYKFVDGKHMLLLLAHMSHFSAGAVAVVGNVNSLSTNGNPLMFALMGIWLLQVILLLRADPWCHLHFVFILQLCPSSELQTRSLDASC